MRLPPGLILVASLVAFGPASVRAEGAGGAAGREEIGRPVLRHYTPGEHLHGLASQRVVQDATGTMFFANDAFLLGYDGAEWFLVPLPSAAAGIRQFTATADGTIYLAGAGVLGYLRGLGREAAFVSLQDQLPPEARDIDELRGAVAIGRTVCFSGDERLLLWRDHRFTVIPYPTPPHSHGARLHRVGDTLYITALNHPLGRLVEDAIEPVADDPVLRDNPIISMEAGPEGSLILLTAEHGFFQLAANGRVAPWATEMNRWLAGRRVFCAQRLADGSHVVGFSAVSGDGGMRFGPDGHYRGPLDTTIGLLVKAIRDFYVDREGGLWLGMDTGAARLVWPSSVSLFDGINGLGQGAVVDVVRQAGVLYAATSEGLFRLVPANASGLAAHFERVRNQTFRALAAHPDGLLALGHNELMVLTETGMSMIAPVPPGAGALLRSHRDPDRVWVGTTHGLWAVRHTPQGWIDEGHMPGFEEDCRSLGEAADGALWVNTGRRGLFRLTFPTGAVTAGRFEHMEAGGKGPSSPSATTLLANVDGDLTFVVPAEGAAKRFDSRTATFLSGPGPLPAEAVEGCQVAARGEGGTLWLAGARGIYQVSPGGWAVRRLSSVVTGTVGEVKKLWEEDGPAGAVLWVAGNKGLARVEVAHAFPAPVPFATRLSAEHVRAGERLPPRHEAPGFSYYAPRQLPTSAVRYQTRLVGYERTWSEWSFQRQRRFADLAAGSYRFEVRARDADGVVTPTETLAFVVLPPWWAAWWMILVYVATGLGGVAGIVQWRTRALRRHAAQLEAIVTERTAELASRNAELVRLNQLELDEKISARMAEEKARLEMLRYQLNPHFLYNTLASISATLGLEPSPARRMVERLADFCRITLHRTSDSDWTTLGEEMKLLRAYLEIEQSRWGDLLEVTIDMAPELAEQSLPHFLLLPLVENALKYGHATSPDRVGLRLAARRPADGALVLEVANTGEWVEPADEKHVVSLGIGFDNLRERLARYYPRAHRLEVSHADGWVIVTLRITLPSPV